MEQPTTSSSHQRRTLPWIILVPGLLIGGLMAGAMMLFNPASNQGLSLPTPVPDLVTTGNPAPNFSGTTPDGETIALSDYRGSIVAVNFWATWCGPCQVEMPTLQEANEQGTLIVLAVNAGDEADAVVAYMQDLGLTFPTVLDADSTIVDLYGVRVFPTTVFVDKDGIVLAERYGPLTPDLIDLYLHRE
jgi:thiol-disulfide isomerase/thioredoxin